MYYPAVQGLGTEAGLAGVDAVELRGGGSGINKAGDGGEYAFEACLLGDFRYTPIFLSQGNG